MKQRACILVKKIQVGKKTQEKYLALSYDLISISSKPIVVSNWLCRSNIPKSVSESKLKKHFFTIGPSETILIQGVPA